MAVRTSCPRCYKRFSAPSDYVGTKVECPRCGFRSVLRTPEEILERELEDAKKRREEKDLERIALIERQDERRRERDAPSPEAASRSGTDSRRRFRPDAPTRFARLRVLSDVLLVGAYLALFLALAGAGVTVYLAATGRAGGVAVLVLGLVGWALVGVVVYLVLKWLAEVAFVVADLADRQNDVIDLLQDIEEGADSAGRREGGRE